ncbi:MAG: hypothetical protein ABR949_07510 [Candidatus Aquilonibacter sp.]|jgi:hypothetical protein
MKVIGLLLAALFTLTAQTPTSAPARHLVYRFGYNTKVAESGNGTGTTTIDILGRAADGGVMISGTDFWWNTARPRATNTCEVYPSGGVNCAQAPYSMSPMQLTLFPLLARRYFSGLAAGSRSTWTNKFTVTGAIIPGASGFAGKVITWDCVFTLVGKGPIAGSAPLILVHQTGKMDQQGARYLSATEKADIAYDPDQKAPVYINEKRAHFPQQSVYNYDLIQMKLQTISPRY